MGPRAVFDAMVKRKIPSPRRESNPDCPARSPALYRLSYYGFLLPVYILNLVECGTKQKHAGGRKVNC
jgi:hypothetical protein